MTFKLEDITNIGTVNIEVQPDGDAWFAEGLEVDYGTQGATIEEAVHNFRGGLEATIAQHRKMFGNTKRIKKNSRVWRDSAILAGMQFLNWGICTISWRAVAQANIPASIVTDTLLATLSFFLFRKIANSSHENAFIPWLGYTIGGVIGTVSGIYLSLVLLGK